MQKGVQLYAIRGLCAENLKKGLQTAAKIGYAGVEFAGFFNHPAKEVYTWLQEYRLQVIGAHVSADEIFDHPDETIAYHRDIGNKRIICPWFDMKTRKDVDNLADKVKAVEALYKNNGMKLYYHNHTHEFMIEDGECLFDYLAAATGLNLEIDVDLICRGGQDPLKYLKEYHDRVEIVHIRHGHADIDVIMNYLKMTPVQWIIAEPESTQEKQGQIDSISKDYVYLNQ
ncbi:MAG: hypothetical protein VB070_11575 [Clostridiaceae bacterium]|nr:hypothetical protein [Clostridiaceae bacterium]